MERDPQFAGRPEFYRVRFGFHFHDDVIFTTDGAKWRRMKLLSARLLRLTMNSRDVSDDVSNELRRLDQELTELRGRDVDPTFVLQTALFTDISDFE